MNRRLLAMPRHVVHLLLPLLIAGLCHPAAAQAPISTTRNLMDQSDFVGFVLADPLGSDPTGEWRQFASPSAVESIKKSLPHEPGGNPFPWIASGHFPPSNYPTWLAAKGEYLIFLKHGLRDGKSSWNAIAAFPVLYRPDASGQITGAIYGDGLDQNGIARAWIHQILKDMLSGKAKAADVRSLDALIQRAIADAARADYGKPVSHEDRIDEVRRLAASIKPGTTRSDVENVFPTEDGGLSSHTTRYVMGSEVIAEVPYDNSGGFLKPGNKVDGPISVYRDSPYYD